MKFVVNGQELGQALSKVVKAVSTKTTNPILEGIKLSVKGDELTLTATDTEISIEKTIISSTFTEGETVVPGKTFSEFIKKLTNEKIELELNDKNQLKINYTDSESFIQCYNVVEFPNLKIIEDGDYFEISQKDFKSLINKSIYQLLHQIEVYFSFEELR